METKSAAPKLGFIRQNDKNFYTARVKVTAGILRSGQLVKLSQIADEFGRGEIYLTVRMNVEIPWIKEGDYDAVAARLAEAGVPLGSSGPSVRGIVSCKGTTCKNGLIDTHALCRAIDKKVYARKLPAKFKMRIAGCPNNCVLAKTNDLDLVAQFVPQIDQKLCVRCGACVAACPVKAVSEIDGKIAIDAKACVNCGKCAAVCAQNAITAKERGIALWVGGKFGKKI